MKYETFKELVFRAYLAFQEKTRKTSMTAFASFLSENPYKTIISTSLLSGWINGEYSPSDRFAIVLAERLPKILDITGRDIYDLLGTEFTLDEDFSKLASLWPSVPEEKRHFLWEQAERYVTENEKRSEQRSTENNI
jgi:hypothetical protein